MQRVKLFTVTIMLLIAIIAATALLCFSCATAEDVVDTLNEYNDVASEQFLATNAATCSLNVTAILQDPNSMDTLETHSKSFTVNANSHIVMTDYYEALEKLFTNYNCIANYSLVPSGGGPPMQTNEFDITGDTDVTVMMSFAVNLTINTYFYDVEDNSEFRFDTMIKKVKKGSGISLSAYTAEIQDKVNHSMSGAGNYEFVGYYNTDNEKIETLVADSDKIVKCKYESYRYVTIYDGTQELRLYFKEDKLYDISTYESSLIVPSGKIFMGFSLENDINKLMSTTLIDKETYAGKTIYAIFHEPIIITMELKLYASDGSVNLLKTYTRSYKYGTVAEISDFDYQMNYDINHTTSIAGNYEFLGYFNNGSTIETYTATSDITLEAKWEEYKYATLVNGEQQFKVFFKEDKKYDISAYESFLNVPSGQEFICWSLASDWKTTNDTNCVLSDKLIDKETYAGKTIYAMFHAPIEITVNLYLENAMQTSFVKNFKYRSFVNFHESFDDELASYMDRLQSAGEYYLDGYYDRDLKVDKYLLSDDNISAMSFNAVYKYYPYAMLSNGDQQIKVFFVENTTADISLFESSLAVPEGQDFIGWSVENDITKLMTNTVIDKDTYVGKTIYAMLHNKVSLIITATLLRQKDDGTTDAIRSEVAKINGIKYNSTVYMHDYRKQILDLFPGIDCEVGPTLGPSEGGVPATITEFVIKGDTSVSTQVFDLRAILTSRYFFEDKDFDYIALDGLEDTNISGFSKGDTLKEDVIKSYINDVISKFAVAAAIKVNGKIKAYPDVVSYKVYTDYNCTQEYVGGDFVCDKTTNYLYVKVVKDKFIVEYVVKDNISNPVFYSYVSEANAALQMPPQNYNTYACVINATTGTGNKYKFIGWTTSECDRDDWDANNRDYDYITNESNIKVDKDLVLYSSNYKYSGLVATWESKFIYEGDETVGGNLWQNIVDGVNSFIPEDWKKWLIGIGIAIVVLVVLSFIIRLIKR